MMTPKVKRFAVIAGTLVCVGVSVALIMMNLTDNLVFYMTPTEVKAKQILPGKPFRLGGLVEKGSIQKTGDDLLIHFQVTDAENTLSVEFKGLLPDLFREGQGVVAQGVLSPEGTFIAKEVLAKHDENYRPPKV
jgi:cytochrome c-type biogenesis protein CcmE